MAQSSTACKSLAAARPSRGNYLGRTGLVVDDKSGPINSARSRYGRRLHYDGGVQAAFDAAE